MWGVHGRREGHGAHSSLDCLDRMLQRGGRKGITVGGKEGTEGGMEEEEARCGGRKGGL